MNWDYTLPLAILIAIGAVFLVFCILWILAFIFIKFCYDETERDIPSYHDPGGGLTWRTITVYQLNHLKATIYWVVLITLVILSLGFA